jgi:hypothetical protein
MSQQQHRIMTGGASSNQKGQAAELRGQHNLTKGERDTCNQIVHSGDTRGQYAQTPNPYRDSTNTYDPNAQAKLNTMKKKYT